MWRSNLTQLSRFPALRVGCFNLLFASDLAHLIFFVGCRLPSFYNIQLAAIRKISDTQVKVMTCFTNWSQSGQREAVTVAFFWCLFLESLETFRAHFGWQFSLYLQSEGFSRHRTLQLISFLFPLQQMKRPALQNKRAGVLRMAHRALNVSRNGSLGRFVSVNPQILVRYFIMWIRLSTGFGFGWQNDSWVRITKLTYN